MAQIQVESEANAPLAWSVMLGNFKRTIASMDEALMNGQKPKIRLPNGEDFEMPPNMVLFAMKLRACSDQSGVIRAEKAQINSSLVGYPAGLGFQPTLSKTTQAVHTVDLLGENWLKDYKGRSEGLRRLRNIVNTGAAEAYLAAQVLAGQLELAEKMKRNFSFKETCDTTEREIARIKGRFGEADFQMIYGGVGPMTDFMRDAVTHMERYKGWARLQQSTEGFTPIGRWGGTSLSSGVDNFIDIWATGVSWHQLYMAPWNLVAGTAKGAAGISLGVIGAVDSTADVLYEAGKLLFTGGQFIPDPNTRGGQVLIAVKCLGDRLSKVGSDLAWLESAYDIPDASKREVTKILAEKALISEMAAFFRELDKAQQVSAGTEVAAVFGALAAVTGPLVVAGPLRMAAGGAREAFVQGAREAAEESGRRTAWTVAKGGLKGVGRGGSTALAQLTAVSPVALGKSFVGGTIAGYLIAFGSEQVFSGSLEDVKRDAKAYRQLLADQNVRKALENKGFRIDGSTGVDAMLVQLEKNGELGKDWQTRTKMAFSFGLIALGWRAWKGINPKELQARAVEIATEVSQRSSLMEAANFGSREIQRAAWESNWMWRAKARFFEKNVEADLAYAKGIEDLMENMESIRKYADGKASKEASEGHAATAKELKAQVKAASAYLDQLNELKAKIEAYVKSVEESAKKMVPEELDARLNLYLTAKKQIAEVKQFTKKFLRRNNDPEAKLLAKELQAVINAADKKMERASRRTERMMEPGAKEAAESRMRYNELAAQVQRDDGVSVLSQNPLKATWWWAADKGVAISFTLRRWMRNMEDLSVRAMDWFKQYNEANPLRGRLARWGSMAITEQHALNPKSESEKMKTALEGVFYSYPAIWLAKPAYGVSEEEDGEYRLRQLAYKWFTYAGSKSESAPKTGDKDYADLLLRFGTGAELEAAYRYYTKNKDAAMAYAWTRGNKQPSKAPVKAHGMSEEDFAKRQAMWNAHKKMQANAVEGMDISVELKLSVNTQENKGRSVGVVAAITGMPPIALGRDRKMEKGKSASAIDAMYSQKAAERAAELAMAGLNEMSFPFLDAIQFTDLKYRDPRTGKTRKIESASQLPVQISMSGFVADLNLTAARFFEWSEKGMKGAAPKGRYFDMEWDTSGGSKVLAVKVKQEAILPLRRASGGAFDLAALGVLADTILPQRTPTGDPIRVMYFSAKDKKYVRLLPQEIAEVAGKISNRSIPFPASREADIVVAEQPVQFERSYAKEELDARITALFNSKKEGDNAYEYFASLISRKDDLGDILSALTVLYGKKGREPLSAAVIQPELGNLLPARDIRERDRFLTDLFDDNLFGPDKKYPISKK